MSAGLPAGGVLVVIPALDEAQDVGDVVRRVPSAVCGLPAAVLVVDDGSADETAARAAEAGALVERHEASRGGGAALRTGYRVALERGAAIVVTMDADGQHLPEELERVVGPVAARDVDLAVGSRVLGSTEGGALARQMGIAVFNRLVSVVTGRRVTDCSNSYRAIRAEALAELDLRQDQFHAAEFLIEALTRGVRTVEVPVTVARRQHGTTKKPRTLRYGLGFTRAIVSAWTRSVRRRAARGPRTGRTQPAGERSAA